MSTILILLAVAALFRLFYVLGYRQCEADICEFLAQNYSEDIKKVKIDELYGRDNKN